MLSIRPDHPRIWMRGEDEWYRNEVGTFAWRVLHGAEQPWPWSSSPANDQAKEEFSYSAGADQDDDYGADNMFNRYDHDFAMRVLEPIIAGKAKKWNWQNVYQGNWTLNHTADEYFADARAKLLFILDWSPEYEYPYVMALFATTAYDWLFNETFSNGQPVLSEQDKQWIRDRLTVHADFLKQLADGSGSPFNAADVDNYYYAMMGLVLYEPARVSDPGYQAINARALEYLTSFSEDFIGKVLPFWESQGADGGWPGGFNQMQMSFWTGGSYESTDNTVFLTMAPVLFAAWTATSTPLEKSLFSIGPLNYMPEFQLHMILPSVLDGEAESAYYDINGGLDPYSRAPWVMPMRAYSRRRFSSDKEQLRLAELGAWVRAHFSLSKTTAGSWDMTDQLLFEDKWVNPRDPVEIGFPLNRLFKSLGWVFMRTGFSSPEDLAALFIAQRYHWSALDPYAQNALMIWYKGALLKGYTSPLLIDNAKQRTISRFPSIAAGAASYAPGSTWDVGPGITRYEDKPDYLYIVADASRAYPRDKLTSWTRRIVFLKPDRFIVIDKVKTAAAGIRRTWTLVPAAAFEHIAAGLLRLQNSGGGALWMKRLSPTDYFTEGITTQSYSLTDTAAGAESLFIHLFQITPSAVTANAPQLLVDEAKLKTSGDTIAVSMPDCGATLFPDDHLELQRRDTSVNSGDRDADASSGPLQFELLQNYPNPFNPSTTIGLRLSASANLLIEIYNLAGTLQFTLFSGSLNPGLHLYCWEGKDETGHDSPSGIYFCRAFSNEQQVCNRKMLLLH
ncbi:MAG TPA: hypothetical protein PKZ83_07135 [bacterium]|nr:hypothetical protein [bacterium]HQJ63843.1 hypothetical protein [bacterium]